jgi:hypothetical protein
VLDGLYKYTDVYKLVGGKLGGKKCWKFIGGMVMLILILKKETKDLGRCILDFLAVDRSGGGGGLLLAW